MRFACRLFVEVVAVWLSGCTEFTVYDDGVNPEDTKKTPGKDIRRELACCTYVRLNCLVPVWFHFVTACVTVV